jgi:4-coumarate--CoA ligase
MGVSVSHLTLLHSPANPAYSADELVNQLETSNSRLLLVHPDFLPTALTAAKTVGIPPENVILFNVAPEPVSAVPPHASIDELVTSGLGQLPNFTERRLSPGEAKKRVAFLSFSSGTTGKPKVGFF